ncbi:MAG: hypothetical protein QOK12_3557, partial [Mycobacterium sp.]|nr:hypothetical protein [Mycobacterium sp.]
GIEERLHPTAVVVERLVVVPTLIQPAPGEVRGWGTPVRPTRAAGSIAPVTRPTRSTTPVAGSTWASWSAGPVVRASGPAWRATAAVARSTLRATLRPAGSTWAAAVRRGILPTRSALRSTGTARTLAGTALRSARRRARLCGREADPGGQCGDPHADGDRGGTGHALEKHGHFPFEASGDAA